MPKAAARAARLGVMAVAASLGTRGFGGIGDTPEYRAVEGGSAVANRRSPRQAVGVDLRANHGKLLARWQPSDSTWRVAALADQHVVAV